VQARQAKRLARARRPVDARRPASPPHDADTDIHFYINPINFVGVLEDVVIDNKSGTLFGEIVSLNQYFYSKSNKLYVSGSNKNTLHDLYINKLAEDSFNRGSAPGPLADRLKYADNDATMPNTVTEPKSSERAPNMDSSGNQEWLKQWAQPVPDPYLYNSYVFVIMHIIDRLMEDNNKKDEPPKKGGAQKGGVIEVNADKNMWDLDLLFQCLGAEKYTPTQRAEVGEMAIEMNEIIKVLCLKRSLDRDQTCLKSFKERVSSLKCSESISLYDVGDDINTITLQVDAAGKNRCSGYISQTLKTVQSIYEQQGENVNRQFKMQKTLASLYDAAGKGNIEKVVGEGETTYDFADPFQQVLYENLTASSGYSFRTFVDKSTYAKPTAGPDPAPMRKFALTIGTTTFLQLHYEWDGTTSGNPKKTKVNLVINQWFGETFSDCSGMDGELNRAINRYVSSQEDFTSYAIFCELLKKTMGDFGQVLYYYLASQNAPESELVLFHTLDRFCAGIGSLFGKGVVSEQHGDANRDCQEQGIISDFHNTFYVTRAQKTTLLSYDWVHGFKGSPPSRCVAKERQKELALKGSYSLLSRQMAVENYKTLHAYGSILELFENPPFTLTWDEADLPKPKTREVIVNLERQTDDTLTATLPKIGNISVSKDQTTCTVTLPGYGMDADGKTPLECQKTAAGPNVVRQGPPLVDNPECMRRWPLYEIKHQVQKINKWLSERRGEEDRQVGAESMADDEDIQADDKDMEEEGVESVVGGAKSKTRKKHRKQKSNRRKYPNKRRSIKSKHRIKKRTLKKCRK
jgi:hypothetical protein